MGLIILKYILRVMIEKLIQFPKTLLNGFSNININHL